MSDNCSRIKKILSQAFRYIDHTGGAVILNTMNSLEKEHGIRFRPAKILSDMVKKGKKFYNT